MAALVSALLCALSVCFTLRLIFASIKSISETAVEMHNSLFLLLSVYYKERTAITIRIA